MVDVLNKLCNSSLFTTTLNSSAITTPVYKNTKFRSLSCPSNRVRPYFVCPSFPFFPRTKIFPFPAILGVTPSCRHLLREVKVYVARQFGFRGPKKCSLVCKPRKISSAVQVRCLLSTVQGNQQAASASRLK